MDDTTTKEKLKTIEDGFEESYKYVVNQDDC